MTGYRPGAGTDNGKRLVRPGGARAAGPGKRGESRERPGTVRAGAGPGGAGFISGPGPGFCPDIPEHRRGIIGPAGGPGGGGRGGPACRGQGKVGSPILDAKESESDWSSPFVLVRAGALLLGCAVATLYCRRHRHRFLHGTPGFAARSRRCRGEQGVSRFLAVGPNGKPDLRGW